MIKWSSSSWCKILGHFTKQIEWLIEGIANCTSTIFCRTKITIFPRIWTKIDSKNKFFQRNKVNLYSFASNDMKIFEKIELPVELPTFLQKPFSFIPNEISIYSCFQLDAWLIQWITQGVKNSFWLFIMYEIIKLEMEHGKSAEFYLKISFSFINVVLKRIHP